MSLLDSLRKRCRWPLRVGGSICIGGPYMPQIVRDAVRRAKLPGTELDDENMIARIGVSCPLVDDVYAGRERIGVVSHVRPV